MIREFAPADAGAVTDLLRAIDPEAVVSEAGVLHWIAAQPDRGRARCFVAVEDATVVGWGRGRLAWETSAEGIGYPWLCVHPERRRHGIGTSLFGEISHYLEEAGARELRTWTDEETGRRFLLGHGFRSSREERASVLEPGAADLSELPALEASKGLEGFRLVSLGEVLDRPRELHTVYTTAALDIPEDHVEDAVGYEDWLRETLAHPDLDRDGSFVVLAGERPVSLAFLETDRARGLAANEMTGTLPEFRGRGLARLAKLATVRWARANAIRAIWTGNDAENAAMLALNDRLGYRPKGVRRFFARAR